MLKYLFINLIIAHIVLGEIFRPPENIRPRNDFERTTSTTSMKPIKIAIVHQEQHIQKDGSYKWSYETENGIIAQEEGVLNFEKGQKEPTLTVKGFYLYPTPDGRKIARSYEANEKGFQPIYNNQGGETLQGDYEK